MRKWRRRLQLPWRLMEPVPTGSVQLPVEAERYTIIMRQSVGGNNAVTKKTAFNQGCNLHYDIAAVSASNHNTAVLWWDAETPSNIAVYSATLPYVIRIVTTGQRLKMSSCDRGLSVLHNSMQVFPPPTPIPRYCGGKRKHLA